MPRFMSLTYGVLPIREQFDEAFFRTTIDVADPLHFSFRNDPRVGNCKMTCSELWHEVCKANAEFHDQGFSITENTDAYTLQETAGDWVSSVLGCLGIEWI